MNIIIIKEIFKSKDALKHNEALEKYILKIMQSSRNHTI